EEHVVGFGQVRIEALGSIDRGPLESEMQGNQAVVAPVPRTELLAHILRKKRLADHSHGCRRIDCTCDKQSCIDGIAIGKSYRGRAPVLDGDLLDIGIGHERAAMRLYETLKRQCKVNGAPHW